MNCIFCNDPARFELGGDEIVDISTGVGSEPTQLVHRHCLEEECERHERLSVLRLAGDQQCILPRDGVSELRLAAAHPAQEEDCKERGGQE